MKALKWLDDHFEEIFLVIFLVLISCVSLIQVIWKKVPFLKALPWTNEFCCFMWIWTVFLSLPYTIRKGSMLRVSVLLDAMPQIVRKTINVLVDLITMACMGLMTVHSTSVISSIIESGETSAAMQWPMWIVYIMMFVGFLLATLRAFQMFIIHIMHFGEKELTTLEQTMQEAAEEAATAKNAEGGGGRGRHRQECGRRR